MREDEENAEDGKGGYEGVIEAVKWWDRRNVRREGRTGREY